MSMTGEGKRDEVMRDDVEIEYQDSWMSMTGKSEAEMI